MPPQNSTSVAPENGNNNTEVKTPPETPECPFLENFRLQGIAEKLSLVWISASSEHLQGSLLYHGKKSTCSFNASCTYLCYHHGHIGWHTTMVHRLAYQAWETRDSGSFLLVECHFDFGSAASSPGPYSSPTACVATILTHISVITSSNCIEPPQLFRTHHRSLPYHWSPSPGV